MMVFTNYYVFLKCAPLLRLGVTHKKAYYGRWHMTTNQIAYKNALEDARHNRTSETETHRSNVKQEELSAERNAIARTEATTGQWQTALNALFGR